MLADFHFLRPYWLLALIPLALLLWSIYRGRHANSAWHRICDAPLLPYLLVTQTGGAGRLTLGLLGAGWLIAVLALAGPTWSKRPQPVYQTLDARVIVLDLSRSMLSPDLKPSRSIRARFKIEDILERSGEGQTGLVVFAGDAFAVSPLTDDTGTIANLLPALSPNIMPTQGSRADLGLGRAAELIEQAGLNRGEIMLITDGGGSKAALDAAEELRSRGFRLSVLGAGTPTGAPIPTEQGGFIKDSAGNIVLPKLDSEALRELAQAGGGRYATLRADGADLDRIMPQTALNVETERMDDFETDSWREEGPWLMLLLIPLGALAFRRGWLMGLALWIAMAPDPSWAWSWADLWARPDQRAARALEQGDANRATTLAQDPSLRGTAAYRDNQYKTALESFSQAQGADAHYNRGNALAKLNRFKEALAAYDAALAEAPDMEDAKANRAAIEEFLRQREQQAGENSESGQQRDEPNEPNDSQGDQEGASSQQQSRSESQQGQESSTQGEKSSPQEEPSKSEEARNRQQTAENESSEATAEDRQMAEGEKTDETPETTETPEQDPAESGENMSQPRVAASKDDTLNDEQRQMMEQWLRRIPDDPGGLLRRKFLYQYRRRDQPAGTTEAW